MNYLKKLDFFGTDLTLNYKGERKYKSNFGFINTLCFGVISILTIVYFFQEIIKKKNPTVITNRKTVDKPEFYNLEKNNVFLTFGLYSEYSSGTFINESIYTITAKYTIKNISLPMNQQYSVKELILEGCNETHLKNEKSNNLQLKNVKNHYCISNKSYNDLKIQGLWTDDFFQGLLIQFFRCSNNSKCASEVEIDKYLESLWIEINIIDQNLESTNFKTPTVFKKKFYTKPFTKKERMYIIATFSKNKIVSDKGFLFEDFIEKDYLEIDKVDIASNNRVTNEFVRIFIECSSEYKLIQRNYMKIPSLLAEVGGILSLVQFFYKIVINPFVNLLFLQEFINNKFYKIKKLKKKEKVKKEKELNKKKINKKKSFHENNSIEEGKINEIKIEKTPNIMLKNNSNYLLSKIKTKFWDLFKIIIFKKKLKTQKNIEKSVKEIKKFFSIDYIFDKIIEIDLIKNIIFDENQNKFIDLYPRYILMDDLKNTNLGLSNSILELIQLKEKKDIYDIKILEKYFFIK